MEEYFSRFGGVRDYLQRGGRQGPAGRLHRDHPRPSALPARPDQRQPAAPEMAERMALNAPIQGSAADIIKVAMLRVDSALREPGCARGCCCRCTTSWSSRSPPGEREALEELVRRGDGRRVSAGRAAGGLGRLRPGLERRGALSGLCAPCPARPLRAGVGPPCPARPVRLDVRAGHGGPTDRACSVARGGQFGRLISAAALATRSEQGSRSAVAGPSAHHWRVVPAAAVADRVVAPVHQGVAPLGRADVAAGALGQVAVDVADDLAHVFVVGVGQVGLLPAQQIDDLSPGGVAYRLAAAGSASRPPWTGRSPATCPARRASCSPPR